jgi:aminopeptidase N
MTGNPQAKYLKDYQAPEFFIPSTELTFLLNDTKTQVSSKLSVLRNGDHKQSLKLDSQVKEIVTIKINGAEVNGWALKDEVLDIPVSENEFELEIEVIVDPLNNTALEGLYKSAGVFCTQCEAEGFRKITPFLDRPDVLSKYTVHVYAPKAEFPHILANGNLLASTEETIENVTYTKNTWQDPHPKPSYLFALVAGDFDLLQDEYTTKSGRKVALELYVDKGNLNLGHHAMASLVKSMKWDEDKYGLEYDLDNYMVVAVDFFNMGAMENKGLNIFNSKYVLADEKTATDGDYHGIEAVIAHEYFHNWTGNRVTCRDWFQLSLKEGLTVFRDQQFSADMGTEVIERISHASVMRTHQFEEDAGPMAHPIRPEKVIEMNNFYTVTVYDKGAEVIRMMQRILTQDGFRKGMDLYFERHDGQAVTCDDFVNAMADANNQDLTQFKNWYSQAGTPVVKVTEQQSGNKYKLTLEQSIPSRPDTEQVKTLVIPVAYELLSKADGKSLTQGTLVFDQTTQTFELEAKEDAVLVLFENFSAPVKVERQQSIDDLVHTIKFATDAFSRWDSMQTLWQKQIQSDTQLINFAELFAGIIADENLTNDIKAELIAIPSFSELAEGYKTIDVDQILDGTKDIVSEVAEHNSDLLFAEINKLSSIENGYSIEKVANRRFKQVLLRYVAAISSSKTEDTIKRVFEQANNMSENILALNAARAVSPELLQSMLEDMNKAHPDSVLVLDKMLSQVARIQSDEVYETMKTWSEHKNFSMKNPNRVRSLYGAFANGNAKMFHDESGKGYEFLTDLLLEIDGFNPQLAARMVVPLLSFKRFDENRQAKMKQALTRLSQAKLSKDMFEKVQASLNG